MKLRSLRYLTREGFRNVWVNRLMSFASIGVLVACMVLIGMAILLTQNVDVYMSGLEKQNVVLVYFNDKNSVLYQDDTGSVASTVSTVTSSQVEESSSKTSSSEDEDASSETESQVTEDKVEDTDIPQDAYLIHNEEEAKAVCKLLKKVDNVQNVEFISASQALKRAKDQAKVTMSEEAFKIMSEENPMSHGAKVTLKSMDKFDSTIEDIKAVKGVHNVVSHKELAKTISDIKNGVSTICFWIIGVLGIIALVIVSNTIRVTMYNRKLEISIMKAVGATDSFVRLPFIIEGVILGLISAVISEGILYFCYRVAGEAMSGTIDLQIPFLQVALPLFGIFAAIGIFAGAFGSLIMIGKYLKKEGSEFKAL